MIRLLSVYHGGRDPQHRGRERALEATGVEVTLVVPLRGRTLRGPNLSPEPFGVIELPARRAGDVNRHANVEGGALRRIIVETRPDVLDLHEEPVSVVARQWLRAASGLPVVMYTAQDLDERFPPPFSRFEAAAYRGVGACTRAVAKLRPESAPRALPE
jgi:hypothetical protein